MSGESKWIDRLEAPLEIVTSLWGIVGFFAARKPPHDWQTIGIMGLIGVVAVGGAFTAMDVNRALFIVLVTLGGVHVASTILAALGRLLRSRK